MAATRTFTYFGHLIAISMALCSMMASEYHGTVKCNGLPFPGATVTAVQGDKKVITTTDDRGGFRFADLADGTWTMEVEALGFEKMVQQVGVAPVTPAPEWELKFLTVQALDAALQPKAPTSQAAPPPAVAVSRPGPAGAPPAGAQARMGGPQGRNDRTAVRGGETATDRRPSLLQQDGFQRLDVNQSAETGAFGSEGTIRSDEIANLNQSAENSFIVQGSMSSALGMPQENDWGFGMHGMGMGPMGGPEGMLMRGPGGAGTDGEPRLPGGEGGDRRFSGGPGGPGGGPPGRGPGGPGGPSRFGGPGGHSDRGGPQDHHDWRDRRDSTVFGNARRDPRSMYNGNVFLGFNNSFWDARSFSVTGAAVDKPSYADARGGFMFGGPLQIPKLVSPEHRIFFMFNYRFDRSRTGTISQPVNMPSALERAGDFSQTMVQGRPVTVFDPATGIPFPGNTIPANRIDSAATGLLKYFPQPNLPFAARNYQTAFTGSNNSGDLSSRISNLRIGSKDRLDGGIGYESSNRTSPNLFQFLDTGSGRGLNANIGWSHNITLRLINNLRYTFSRNRQLSSPYFANRDNVAASLGIAGTSQNPMNWGPPNLSFTNYANLSDGNASLTRNQTGALTESLMWVHGNQNLSFGGSYRRQQFNAFADNNGRGTYTFNGYLTSAMVNGIPQNGTGYDLADFLLGMPASSSIRYGNPDKYFRGSAYSLFANNDWRIRTNFSIVFGLRWDYTAPMTELYGRLANLDIAPGFSAVTPVQPGQPATYSGSLPNSLIRPDWNNFSPRFGFAWRPSTSHSLVVRGGYGMYYNTSVYNLIANNMAQQPPFASVLSATSSPANPLSIQNAFLLASNQLAGNTYAIDPNYRIGYAQIWNLTVQHDLPFGMFGTAGYQGTKGTRLDQQFIPNSVPPGVPESALPHGFIYETSNGNSTYHAAQFQLNRRFRSGFMANVSYQLSKSIDNAGTGGRGQGNTPVAQDWLDLSAERGLSSFDARHNLSLNFQYSTGMGRTGGTLLKGWQGALAKDWTFSANMTVRSGSPFTAIVGGNRSQVGGTAVGNTVRADATGLPVEVAGMLFNTAAFAAPAAGLWGDAGRNTIPGPTTFFLNGSVGRIFRLAERRSIDLQLQAQNALNHVTITSWGTVVGANNYGLAANAAGMRKITAMLRFRF